MGGDGEIGVKGGVIESLEDEPFSPPIFLLFLLKARLRWPQLIFFVATHGSWLAD